MASLFKRKKRDGTYAWYVTYYQDGKHHMQSTGTTDRKLAQEVLKKVETDQARIAQGLPPVIPLVPIILSEFIPRYLEDRRRNQRTPKTLEADAYALDHLLVFLGDGPLTAIREAQVRVFRQHLSTTVKPGTVNLILRHLKGCFSWAVEGSLVKYLVANPFAQRDLFLKLKGDNLPRCLSPEEKKRFFAAVERDDHRRYFQFLLLTGCRRNEALNLSWSDIDWNLRQITFRKTKSGRDRIVPIGLELMQVLLQLDQILPRPFPFKPDYVTHEFGKIVKRANLGKEIHLHCLRHTAASDLVRQGVHLSKIQKLLGHSSASVTERYIHVLPEDLRDVADRLTCLG